MKRLLVIEWKHIGNTVTGTCERCSLTGGAILDVLEEVTPYFKEKNVTSRFRETVLPDSQIEESNQVLINSIPLENYLSGAKVVQTPCCSCACLTGQDEAECRAIDYGGDRYEAITPNLLKQVIIALVESWDETCGCVCDCGTNTKGE
jgi:hypothetical protein